MHFALDAGHGQSSKTAGVYDPGAMLQGHEEHKLAVGIVDDLEAALVALGHRVYRPTGLFTQRDDKAKAAGVDFYLSVHFNGGPGSGSEAFVNRTSATPQAKAFAADVSARLARVMGIPDRGRKYADWAVLSANRNDALVEVCFPADVKKYLANKDAVTLAILNALLKANGLPEVASLEGGTDMYWLIIAIFGSEADASGFAKWCAANGIASQTSGAACIAHGNDEKSRGAEAEAERRSGVCPWGRVYTTQNSYKHFSRRAPYVVPEAVVTSDEGRVTELENALDQIDKHAHRIIDIVDGEVS